MSLVHRNLAFSISVSSQVHFVRKKIRKLSVIATKEEKSGPLSPPKRGQVHDQYHLFSLSFLFSGKLKINKTLVWWLDNRN